MYDRQSLLAELQQIFHQVFDDKSIQLTEATTAADIGEWNSLNHMHLIAEIESHFALEFTFDEVVNFKNVGDMIKALIAKKDHGI
jgi:acyl carrier protein